MSVEAKKKIENCLQSFSQGNLTKNSLNLFEALGYNTAALQAPFTQPTFSEFKASYAETNNRFNEEKALFEEWNYVDLLFQLSKDEITQQHSLFDTKRVDNTIIESYLFFAIELAGKSYTRTSFAQITREINKLFPMPVMILFKTGKYLTLSVINRRLHKRDEMKDVLEKVTLIKDISIENPHRAHIEIFFDLSFDELLKKHKFTNFVELHNAWQKTLDTKELNKRFYRELSDWYFWAMDHVSFPDDTEKDKNIRNATNLIRLITRVIFIWFIKEKHLIPEKIFDKKEVSKILIIFQKSKKAHNYYLAILQNLFFGTLNQKMGERKFTKNGDIDVNKKEYGVKTLFRYPNLFSISENEALNLFKDVPFLNGGLFDCLDRENDKGKVIYIDGFSRNPSKQAVVPDFLFFGEEQRVDLSEIYGDKKRKKEKVKGLFNILSSYKFTITENTPIEEEIALDPELLGKVFENLLASYNPETQTTARKHTGSFYTPREIVNYMVDESLKAYLKSSLLKELPGYVEIGRKQTNMFGNEAKTGQLILQEKLGPGTWHHKEEDLDKKLGELFGYNEIQPFTDEESISRIIKSLDNAKILDPACGSGAFPMGVLHKMVHILEKLDPDNMRWREVQKKKALKETEEAYKIGDKETRQLRLLDIDDAFENNASGFGRKLYLIENCVFGIDIQPITIQICKLRFFISLIVDQTVNSEKENFGIRSLPNLETKFVAANTLIGLDKPKEGDFVGTLFDNQEILSLEKKLKELRHKYFGAKTRKEKLACQKEDKKLRQKIAKLLEKDGWKHKTAEQIVAFDPYDQNASSPFFDAEWMFGLKAENAGERVFDVVIGNPPYVRQESIDTYYKPLYIKNHPDVGSGTADMYIYFFDSAFRITNQNGIIVFITLNKYLKTKYGEGLRKKLKEVNVDFIIDFFELPVFEASTDCAITKVINANDKNSTKYFPVKTLYNLDLNLLTKGDYLKVIKEGTEWKFISQEFEIIFEKLYQGTISLNDFTKRNIYYGIKTGNNKIFIIDDEKKNEIVNRDYKSKKHVGKYITGTELSKWSINKRKEWLITTFPGKRLNIDEFKGLKIYLSKFKSELMPKPKNHKGEWNGRKAGSYKWFETQDNVAY